MLSETSFPDSKNRSSPRYSSSKSDGTFLFPRLSPRTGGNRGRRRVREESEKRKSERSDGRSRQKGQQGALGTVERPVAHPAQPCPNAHCPYARRAAPQPPREPPGGTAVLPALRGRPCPPAPRPGATWPASAHSTARRAAGECADVRRAAEGAGRSPRERRWEGRVARPAPLSAARLGVRRGWRHWTSCKTST